jgi:predicted porin
LSAIFLSELDFNASISNTANQSSSTSSFAGTVYNGTPFNGEQYVGLQSAKFGSLKLGTPNSPALDTSSTSQPFGTALGSGYSSGFGRLGTNTTSGLIQYVGAEGATGRIIRSEKAVVYTSPVYSGVTAQVEYSGQNDRGTWTANDNEMLGLSAKYNQGPLNAQVYHGKASAGATQAAGSNTIANLSVATSSVAANYAANALPANASVTWNMLGANYNMGATTVYAGYTTTKTDGTTTAAKVEDSKSWNLGAKYVMGNIDLLANYLVRKSNLSATDAGFVATDANSAAYAADAKLLGLGANYNLSKNTSVYYRYEAITGLNYKISGAPATASSNGLAAPASYNDAKQVKQMIGLRLAF